MGLELGNFLVQQNLPAIAAPPMQLALPSVETQQPTAAILPPPAPSTLNQNQLAHILQPVNTPNNQIQQVQNQYQCHSQAMR